jgi:quercetin dioxygenase-like cupin family protein
VSSYFDRSGWQEPAGPGRFVKVSELPEVVLAGGLVVQPLSGENVMVSFAHYEAGAEAPLHAHAEEQIFFVVEGAFDVQLGEESRRLTVGEAMVIPAWVPHRVQASEDGPAEQIDIFSPPREGILRLQEESDADAAS